MYSTVVCQGSVMNEKLGYILRSWRKRKVLLKELDHPKRPDTYIEGSTGPGPKCAWHPRALDEFPKGLLLTVLESWKREPESRSQNKVEETQKGDLRPKLKEILCFNTHSIISRWRRQWVEAYKRMSQSLRGEDFFSQKDMTMILKNDILWGIGSTHL